MSKLATVSEEFSQDAIKDATALIQGMELPYLQQLQTVLSAEIDKRQKDGRRDAIAKIRALAASAGIDLESLASPKLAIAKTPKASAPIKFRHPENASLEWSGRGRQQRWVKEWVESGKSIEDLRVA